MRMVPVFLFLSGEGSFKLILVKEGISMMIGFDKIEIEGSTILFFFEAVDCFFWF